jgi:hypothetical protein
MKHTLTKMDFMSCDCFIIRRYTDYLTIRFCSMIYLDEHLRDVIENSSASAQLLIFLQFRQVFVRRGGFPSLGAGVCSLRGGFPHWLFAASSP